MAYTFSWAWYNNTGTAWVNLSAGNLIGFYGTTTYGDKITVDEYNDGMHLRTAIGTDTDACAAPHCDNIKFLANNYCDINGGGNVAVNTITDNDCIRLHFTDTVNSINTENALFYAWASGGNDADAPVGVNVRGLESADEGWTSCGGNAAAFSLSDQNAAVDHYFYVALSAGPTSVGQKDNFAWKITLDYF